jgi:AcrR family transcriptional regulator
VSPRPADPAVRTALIEAGARILAVDGPGALSTRRLAAETGTSTMAVYTYFGSMDELRRGIRAEGFARLAGRLGALPRTRDAVADLAAGGLAYLTSGLDSPALYRAMFTDRPPAGDDDAGAEVFQRVVDDVTRCMAAGRFDSTDPSLAVPWAGEIWTMRHGMVTLVLSGLLPTEQARFLLTDMTYRLVVGYGDTPSAARPSVEEGMRGTPEMPTRGNPVSETGGIPEAITGMGGSQ